MNDVWALGDRYEPYVGRWSRAVAPLFVRWLDSAPRLRWVDVGCGTGALMEAVLTLGDPASVVGYEPSPEFAAWTEGRLTDPRARLVVGDAASLAPGSADVVVSGLVVNFVAEPVAAVRSMAATAPGGTVAAYVWDYAEGMQLIRRFWDVAVALDPAAAPLDEAVRFPDCHPEGLAGVWTSAGLENVATTAFEVPTVFTDFDDLWSPFLGGQGPAPGYVMGLEPSTRDRLRDALRDALPAGPDGAVALTARAYAVRGTSAG